MINGFQFLPPTRPEHGCQKMSLARMVDRYVGIWPFIFFDTKVYGYC